MFTWKRELETEQKLQYFDPTLMSISVVSFWFSLCSTGGPGAHSAGFLYYILSATSLDPNSSGPQGPPPPGFLYHILSSNSSNLQLSWQSYIMVQRPLNRPLNPWNGMFDRHQAEITVMQFTGHSLPVCIMGFTLSHFVSQIHPRDLFRILAIGMCHFLPVHHFGVASLAGSKVKIQQ